MRLSLLVIRFAVICALSSAQALFSQDARNDQPHSQPLAQEPGTTDDGTAIAMEVDPLSWPEPNPDAPYARPPELKGLLRDDFSTDTRGDYQIVSTRDLKKVGDPGAPPELVSELSEWEPGKLTLRKGGALERRTNAEDWIELELDLEFAELTEEDGHVSELRIQLDLEPASDSCLLLKQEWRDGAARSTISVVEWLPNEGREEDAPPDVNPRLVRQLECDEMLANGRWRIGYRCGLWSVTSPDNALKLYAFIENSLVHIKQISVAAEHKNVAIQSMALSVVDRPALSWTPEQQAQLASAQEWHDRVKAAFQTGPSDESIQLALQARTSRLEILGRYHLHHAASLTNLALLYRSRREFVKAEPLLFEARAISESVRGTSHPNYAKTLINLSALFSSMGAYQRAEPFLFEANLIQEKVLGDEHPDYVTTLRGLAWLYMSLGKYDRAEPLYQEAASYFEKAAGREHPEYAKCLDNLASLYDQLGDWKSAERLLIEARAIQEKALGKQHQDYVQSTGKLGSVYLGIRDYARAVPLFLEVNDILETLGQQKHPHYAGSLGNLGAVYYSMGDYAQAEPLLLQTRSIQAETTGKQHPDYAQSLFNLAALYEAKGEYARAEPLYLEAMSIQESSIGKEHPSYAWSLYGLAGLYVSMGYFAQAELMYLDVSAILEKALGKAHPDYPKSLVTLASLYEHQGEFERAERLLREAEAILRDLHGTQDLDYATVLFNHARVNKNIGDLASAETQYLLAREIVEGQLGKESILYASCVNDLAAVYQKLGDFARAEPLYLEAMALREIILGKDHPHYAHSLANLAMLYQQMSRFEQAESLYLDAFAGAFAHLERTSAVQSESQQFQSAQSAEKLFTGYLSLVIESGRAAQNAATASLRWKGAILARQGLARLVQETGDPQIAALLGELQTASSRLATLTFNLPANEVQREVWQRQMQELSADRDRIEKELSSACAEYRDITSQTRIDVQQLQATLPPEVALVDIQVFYTDPGSTAASAPADRKATFCAFVIRRERPVELVVLGPWDEVSDWVKQWRQAHGASEENGSDPGLKLRQLLWDPLASSLNDVRTVLISPVGPATMFPWSALPGKEPGTFLVEERALVTVPVPQMLPGILAANPPKQSQKELLLVGDVDFDKQQPNESELVPEHNLEISASSVADNRGVFGGRSSIRREAHGQYGRLPGTASEIQEIALRYQEGRQGDSIESLIGSMATKQRFQELAPNCRYLHVATHGFFAPDTFKSAFAQQLDDADHWIRGSLVHSQVTGFHPALLSGLVFAGANQPIDPHWGDNSVLTAIEVAQMNLSGVELVVLSACETGLGQVAGGEGVLGLQRAFQVAGAKSTVTSLWKVDDAATRILMSRFYENLWGETKLSRVEALREAQIWMLRHPDELKQLGIADPRRRSGGDDDPEAAHGSLSHPYYWAAWVLSGDWR